MTKEVFLGGLYRLTLLLVTLEISSVIHEFGHLRAFQKYNVPVEEFSIGVGPAVYQYKIEELTLSLRVIPLISYVKTTTEGNEIFKNKLNFWNRTAVNLAGVRNNSVTALAIIFLLQFLGWQRKNISNRAFIKGALLTPFKMIMRFFAFLIESVTFRKIKLAHKFYLSTGKVILSPPVAIFILVNLVLGMLNLTPILPLDGGQVAIELMPPLVAKFLSVWTIPIFLIFFIVANLQNIRVLEDW